jgi:hypothetical protein
VGKRSLNLMGTVNAKRDGRPFTGVSTNFLKVSHEVTRLVKEHASFLKTNDINDINDIAFFGTPDCHHCCFKTYE